MAEADDGEDLAAGLEVLPGARGRAAKHVLKAQAACLPGLVGERALLVLLVEGADGGEIDPGVAAEHRRVLPELVVGDRPADWQHRDPDHGPRLHAHVWLHRRRGVAGDRWPGRRAPIDGDLGGWGAGGRGIN